MVILFKMLDVIISGRLTPNAFDHMPLRNINETICYPPTGNQNCCKMGQNDERYPKVMDCGDKLANSRHKL